MSPPAASATTPVASDVPPAQLAAWIAFLQAHARAIGLLEKELRAEEDLPLSWYDVLVQLEQAPDRKLRMQELADAVLLSKSGLTRLIDRMQRAGLVERAACSSDRRGTYAGLTDEGLATLRAAAPTHMRGIREHFCDLFDDEEAQLLEHLLRRIADAAVSRSPNA